MKKIFFIGLLFLLIGCARIFALDTNEEIKEFFTNKVNENDIIFNYKAYSISGSKDLRIEYFIDRKSYEKELYPIYMDTYNFLISEDIYNYVYGLRNGIRFLSVIFVYEDDEYYYNYRFTNNSQSRKDISAYRFETSKNKVR